MLRKIYNKLGGYVHSPYANPLLAFLFFLEAIFFIPVDPLLILYCIEHRKRAFYFAALATSASVLGGIAAYFIGYSIWETVGQKLVTMVISPEKFDHAVHQFKLYEIWAVLIGGFTPVPYKAITLAAGFCKLPLLPFILCSIIARGARFFLIAGIISIWGVQIKEYIDRYFNLLVVLFVIIVGFASWLLL